MTPEPDWDGQLRATFAAAPAPPTPPGLSFRIRRRLRRRRLLVRGGAGAAVVAALASCVLAWQSWPGRPAHPEAAGVPSPPPAPAEAAFPETAAYLRSAPPVETLDLLARQQAAYRTLLDDLEKEF